MATIDDFRAEWLSDSPTVEATTSGSTGAPKIIQLLKTDMEISARATNKFFGITASSVLALPLSVDYIAGKMMVVRSITAGCRLVPLPVSNHIALPCRVDLLPVVPSQVPGLLETGELKNVRNLLVGGAPLGSDLEKRLAHSPSSAWVGYGMTETCSHVALRRAGSDVYRAMPSVTFSTDSRGCLVVNSEVFSWKQLITNDSVKLLSPAEFRWLGRLDHVINSGGVKIHPEILEAEIRRNFPQTPPFYVIGEPDTRWGEHPVMVVEPGPCPELAQIKAALGDPRQAPQRIITVARLPLTTTGKIKRLSPTEI